MKKERVRKGGRKLSLYIRNLILTYKASGLSTVKIQRKLQSTQQFITSRQGIRNFINRHKKTGSVVDQRKKRTGQVQQIHINYINMWMLRNPEETAESIRNRLETQHGVTITKEYVCALRRKLNWTPSNVKYGQMISHKNVLVRLDWSIQEFQKKDTYENVIYVDESTVEMSSCGRLYFYQPGSQLDRLPSKAPKPKHSYKVNVWGGISYRGRTAICIFTGIMDSIIYQKILEDNLLPFTRRKFPDGFRLYQDNDSKHKSKSTQNWIRDQGLTESVMTTPASSPDLNPIENVWSALKGHLRCVVKPKTKDQLVDGIVSFWESLTAEQCGKYIDHVHRVIPHVILNRGGPTNF